MSERPLDTSEEMWQMQLQVLRQMAPEHRVRIAVELSDTVRELQIQGVLARNPTWSRAEAVDWLIKHVIAPDSGSREIAGIVTDSFVVERAAAAVS